ncbi:cwf18 pre-mRNA splicing factor-domain-containing protein [Kalaharituber pfeilii]|nr:cwf18 pre-mRNA splicing factor-domain-containing protein [Kalaharituber pfeilii]
MSSLDAQAEERKKRLAQLKGLKRKQTESEDASSKQNDTSAKEIEERGIKLSGRNFDVEERAPKMGFTYAPTEGQETIETKAEEIIQTVKAQQVEEEAAEKPIDLFNLQPKKPNWDLKRDVEKKLDRLRPRTKSAIARIIRERINNAKAKSKAEGSENGADEAANSAVEGRLAELVREREKEKEEEEDAD